MKLNEKLMQCRRKLGLSQEELAARIGVSRQSISKWETGEASPEISKLPLLAKEFNVTIDWLLSDREDETKNKEPVKSNTVFPSWIDKLPSHILKMAKRFGWLYGIYIAIGGAFITVFGLFARMMFKTMILGDSQQTFNNMFYDFGMSDFKLQSWKMFSMFTGFVIGIGVFITLIGIILAAALKIWGNKKEI